MRGGLGAEDSRGSHWPSSSKPGDLRASAFLHRKIRKGVQRQEYKRTEATQEPSPWSGQGDLELGEQTQAKWGFQETSQTI